MAITLDTNWLIRPTQRRFNAAWHEMSGTQVQVLPRVAEELTHYQMDPDCLREQVEEAEAALLRMQNRVRPNQRLMRQSDIWWGKNLIQEDGIYRLISMSAEQHELADAICRNIDVDAFPSMAADLVSDNSDTIIIAQALATGTQMLVTGNMRSINHDAVNDWAARNSQTYGFAHPEVLYVQDALMTKLHAAPAERLKLAAIGLGAAWPEHDDPSLSEIDACWQTMSKSMEGAQLKNTGAVIDCVWRDTPDPEALLRFVRERLPRKMRDSERSHPAWTAARNVPDGTSPVIKPTAR